MRDGFDVLVHCKGGLGRAGTIAARLLVELGTDPDVAIRQVRKVRPYSIETAEQAAHVRAQSLVPEPEPSRITAAILDRANGALVGLAVGDAVGTTLEFQPRDSYAPLTDMIGGGPFRLSAGEWTDDTAMALALAVSLIHCNGLDPVDLLGRFVHSRETGAYSCTGTCFDIGSTVSAALSR
jgi:ADP-ribosyl-[dinitrogen reductase] hydrolase